MVEANQSLRVCCLMFPHILKLSSLIKYKIVHISIVYILVLQSDVCIASLFTFKFSTSDEDLFQVTLTQDFEQGFEPYSCLQVSRPHSGATKSRLPLQTFLLNSKDSQNPTQRAHWC